MKRLSDIIDSVAFGAGVALMLVALALSGCKATPTVDRPTAAYVADLGACVDRADAKLAEAEPLIESERPKVLVSGARADIAEAKGIVPKAEASAQKDTKIISKQQEQLDKSSLASQLRAWATWFIVGGIVLGAIGAALAFWLKVTPLVLEVALFVIAAGVLCNWLSYWWVQVGLLALVLAAVAWFIWSPLPNLNKTTTEPQA